MKSLLTVATAAALTTMASGAFAADIARPVYKAAPVEMAPSWTGFYVGGHVGYGWARDGSASVSETAVAPPDFFFFPVTTTLNAEGAVVGGQIGYNWQASNLVFGIEADISGSFLKKSASITTFESFAPGVAAGTMGITQEIDWLASVRGRIGYAFDRSMIYATGGFAWAKVSTNAVFNGSFPFSSAANLTSDDTRTGYVVGGGFEHLLGSNWTIRAEYLDYALDGGDSVSGPIPNPALIDATATLSTSDLNIHVARLGLNYKF
jgi:outer membrane immunogenic protein